MKVYAIDNSGYFLGEIKCQKDPKNKKGEYLIPNNSVETTPPNFNEDEIPKWNTENKEWEIIEHPSVEINRKIKEQQEKKEQEENDNIEKIKEDAKKALLVEQETERLNELLKNDYRTKRKRGYGPIEEQLDMIYWDKINGTEMWKDHITKVKIDNPKEEQEDE